MSFRTLFRLSLLLPLLFAGAFALGNARYGSAFTEGLPHSLATLWLNVSVTLDMVWPQYLAVIAFLAWGFGRWPLQNALLHGVLGPVYYAVLLLVTLFIYGELSADPLAEDIGIFAAIFSVTYGYLYVGLVLAAYYTFKQLGLVSST